MSGGRLTALALGAVCCALALPATGSGGSSGPPAAASTLVTRIMCLNGDGDEYVPRRKPRTCAVLGSGGSFGGGVNLHRLRWRAWAEGTARARGREFGFHLPHSNIIVRVRAYRLRRACGRRVYTRLKATSRFGTTVVSVPRCPRPAF